MPSLTSPIYASPVIAVHPAYQLARLRAFATPRNWYGLPEIRAAWTAEASTGRGGDARSKQRQLAGTRTSCFAVVKNAREKN